MPLVATSCAICGKFGGDELYRANFTEADLNPGVFSARRPPDRVHHRMVVCQSCGLVRSDPILSDSELARLYAASAFTYGDETQALRVTYGRLLSTLRSDGAELESLLEVGCGNGFFLEEALRQGYRRVAGIEPSSDAVALASDLVREAIHVGVIRPGIFAYSSFSVICFFQVLDHLPDPKSALAECRRLLRPNGLLLVMNHDAAALSARLLGASSPIIDIEHTYLFSRTTLGNLLASAGFSVIRAGTVIDHHRLEYLLTLTPLPRRVKSIASVLVRSLGLGRLHVPIPLGNQYAVARPT